MGYLPYRTLREATKTVHTSCNIVPHPPLRDSQRAEPQYVVVDATSARELGRKVSPLEDVAHHLIMNVE